MYDYVRERGKEIKENKGMKEDGKERKDKTDTRSYQKKEMK